MDEELALRLGALEQAEHERQEEARLNNFKASYGNMFSNDNNLALAILNQCDLRGIDTTAAASDAVQTICDELRAQCMDVLNKLKENTNQVVNTLDTLQQVDEAVQAAQGQAQTPPAPDAGMAPPPMDNGMEPPATDAGMAQMPPAPDAGMAAPPMDNGMEPPAPDAGMVPPMDNGMTPPPSMPQAVPSDKRLKNFRRMHSPVSVSKAQVSMFKPSAGILAAARSI